MDDKKIEKKAKAIPDGVPILAWEFDKKDTPSIMVLQKQTVKYISKNRRNMRVAVLYWTATASSRTP